MISGTASDGADGGGDVTPAPLAAMSARVARPCSTLRLDRALPASEGVGAAFSNVLAYAAAQIVRAGSDPAKAIHEYRKSIRRARAVVRLLRPLLKTRRYEQLDGELRQAVLDTSFVRDAEVLGETIEALPPAVDLAAAIEAVRALAAAQQAAVCTPTSVCVVLARGIERLALLPARLAKASPATIAPVDLEEALRESYRRARRRYREAVVTRTDEDIHGWRKRTKELRYQLELLEPADAEDEQPHERSLGQVAKGLGLVTDLMVLRAAVRANEDALGGAHAAALVAALDALIPARFAALAAQAAPTFAARPREYARAVLSPGLPPPAPPPGDGVTQAASS